jgi:hypothetical protein
MALVYRQHRICVTVANIRKLIWWYWEAPLHLKFILSFAKFLNHGIMFSLVPEFALPAAPSAASPFTLPPSHTRTAIVADDADSKVSLMVANNNPRPLSRTNSLTQLGLLHEQQLIEKVLHPSFSYFLSSL